jgi:hypothetical protein
MIFLHESWTEKFPRAGVSRRPSRPYFGGRDRDLPPAANVDPGLLISQVEHGPQLHGGIVPVVLMAIAVVGVLVYLVYRSRTGSNRDPGSDRDPGPDRGPE